MPNCISVWLAFHITALVAFHIVYHMSRGASLPRGPRVSAAHDVSGFRRHDRDVLCVWRGEMLPDNRENTCRGAVLPYSGPANPFGLAVYVHTRIIFGFTVVDVPMLASCNCYAVNFNDRSHIRWSNVHFSKAPGKRARSVLFSHLLQEL